MTYSATGMLPVRITDNGEYFPIRQYRVPQIFTEILCKSGGGGNQNPPPEPLSDDFDDGKYIEGFEDKPWSEGIVNDSKFGVPSSADLDSVVEEREVKDKTADPEC